MKRNEPQRRKFIKGAAMVSAATIIPSTVWASKVSANDTVGIALIGCRKRGFSVLKQHLAFKDVRCIALCDIDNNVLNERAEEIKNEFNQSPVKYNDYRKMLENKDIDAVIIGTPDHWHCLNMVHSTQAGKDVYVEKPMANTIEECNIMVRASNYYNRVVQVGQQQRSSSVFIQTMKLVKSGVIGSLRKVNMWANFNYGLGTEPAMDEPVPEGVDYDMWLGPAPNRPFNRNHFHGSWRHFWPYGGGMFSDWGVHLIDMGLWVKDLISAPRQVMTYATNNSSFEMKRDTFDTMNVIYPARDFVINYDMTAGVQRGPHPLMYGVAFIGDKGTIKSDRGKYELISEWDDEKKQTMTEEEEFKVNNDSSQDHARNFIDCIKSRNTTVCPPEVGRAAAIHVHIANISARTAEPFLIWDDQKNRFTNSEKANSYIVPKYRAPWTLPKIS